MATRTHGVLGSWLVAIALGACSDDVASIPASNLMAQESVTRISELATALSAMDAIEVSASVRDVLAAGQLIVVPQDATRLRGQIYRLRPLHYGGTGTCTSTSCAFTSFGGLGGTMVGVSISGTIDRRGDTLTLDVTCQDSDRFQGITWAIDGSVTVAGRMDGHLHAHGERALDPLTPPGALTWDLDIDYDDIPLDEAGCPSGGGTVDVVTRYDSEAYRELPAQRFHVRGTATVSPGCATR